MTMRWLAAALVGASVGLSGCSSPTSSRISDSLEAVSFAGHALERPQLPEDRRLEFESNLAAAEADLEAMPEDETAIIWYGRRQAYLGHYRDAIATYSYGLSVHPDSYRLLRHRGHRYITTRRLHEAVADLSRAARLIEGVADEIEPDGLPNARNIPTSTSHTNIYYHLGLARYLQGDYERALDAYERCLSYATNPDMEVATLHWTYMTLRRLGRHDDAAQLVRDISPDLDIIENTGYHRLLLLYNGTLQPEDVEPGGGDEGVQNATVLYGIGNWYLAEGDREKGLKIFNLIAWPWVFKHTSAWAAFGYIAAEADLVREASGG